MSSELEIELAQQISSLSTNSAKTNKDVKELKQKVENMLATLQQNHSKLLSEESYQAFYKDLINTLEEIHGKNIQQDKALADLQRAFEKSLHRIQAKVEENLEIVKQISIFDVQGRINQLEDKQSEQKAVVDLFASIPKILQYLLIIAFSAFCFGWVFNLFR